MDESAVLIRDAELGGAERVDVRISGGIVAQVGTGLDSTDARVVDAGGAALLPGLHDHHLHLLATAAAQTSVVCGPPSAHSQDDLRSLLRAAPTVDGWVRGIGYDEAVAGDLDRTALDALRDDVAVRVQHRSGALWVVNSRGLAVLGLDGDGDRDLDGLERDADGRPTGRLWRLDAVLRERLGPPPTPDLGALSRRLAGYGVTGVTDATPDLDAATVRLLTDAMAQHVVLLGDPAGTAPCKIVVPDHDLPDLHRLAGRIADLRPRAVAVHAVTRVSLVVAAAALGEAGAVAGDRIEHAAVAPPEVVGLLRELGVTVVTQPSLLAARGDDYLDRSEPDDRAHLWPHASLLAAGVPVGCSSDAPYGDLDPWATVRAAIERRAPSGRVVGERERVDARAALGGFLSAADDPGGPARTVCAGAPADLALLDAPLADVLADPRCERVRLTLIGGRVVHDAADRAAMAVDGGRA